MLYMIISLIGYLSLSIFASSFLTFCSLKKDFNVSLLKNLPSPFLPLFKKLSIKNFYLLIFFSKQILLLLFSISFFHLFPYFLSIIILIFIIIILEVVSKTISHLPLFSFLSIPFMYLLLPVIYPFLKLFQKILKKRNPFLEGNLLDILSSKGPSYQINKKILSSLITFQKKVAREVMIPRINVFSLHKKTSIKEAIKLNAQENYSRIPVYEEQEDNIIGILMYKDILQIASDGKLAIKIENLIKPVLYVPENKKISLIFNEFREKKSHMAIVVNEYGSSEGVITIEDILEELVGEIEDEYDFDEKKHYQKFSENTWIVDAQMSIIDLEKKLNISIPHSTEYETIGGFLFHKAGFIPQKGWYLHLDNCDIQVISSNERRLKRLKITLKKSSLN